MGKSAAEFYRLVTTNSGVHDFPDQAAWSKWWSTHYDTAGVSYCYKMSVTVEVVGVYPGPYPAPTPPPNMPALMETHVTRRKHTYAGGTWPIPG